MFAAQFSPARIARLVGPVVVVVTLGLLFSGCGSTPAAAQLTVTAPAVIKTAPPVTMTATETVVHTLAPVTKVSTVVKTTVKTAPPVTVNHTKTVIQTLSVTVTAQPPAAASSFGEGTQLIGTDIKAGTYRAAGGSSCYWERLSGASGNLDDIIANDVVTINPVVEIAATDFAFNSNNCGDWTKIG